MSTQNNNPPQKRGQAKGAPSSTHPPEHSDRAGHYDFTLQAIMELQKSLGSVENSIDRLEKSVESSIQRHEKTIESLKSSVDDLVKWKFMIVGGAAAIGFLIGIAALLVKLAEN